MKLFNACPLLAATVICLLTAAGLSSTTTTTSTTSSSSSHGSRSSTPHNSQQTNGPGGEKATFGYSVRPEQRSAGGEQTTSGSKSQNAGDGSKHWKQTARQTPPEGLFKEFWQSLYVDRTFNSSFALNVPLFTLTIPGYGRGLKTPTALSALNVGNLAVLGIVVLGGLALVAPVIFPEVRRRRSLEEVARQLGTNPATMSMEERQGIQGLLTRGLVGVSESIMGWIERSVDDLPSFPRLDAQECMKRSVCEAHNQPKKYGAVGLMMQLFFPPYTETEESPTRVVSKYQLAARYGRQENANCSSQYDGCMVNLLDIIQAMINLVF